jgi:hypothetical protein
MPLKDRYPTNGSSRKGLSRKVAQAAAKKSWQNRDLPNWRDRVGDLLNRSSTVRRILFWDDQVLERLGRLFLVADFKM